MLCTNTPIMSKTTATDNRSSGPPTIIHAALLRSATKSMAEAYKILGYHVHHTLDDVPGQPWTLLEHAAEATWPWLPDAVPRPPHTRKDWDAIWGSYDVVTDISSAFTPQLVEAYPEAKVVIVERNVDTWWPSFKAACLDGSFDFWPWFAMVVANRLFGIRAGPCTSKLWRGLIGVKTIGEVRDEAKCKEMHRRYYATVRAMVPEERKLEYKMGDGWGPLCEFLGKEVPDVPFPRVNDRAEQNKGMRRDINNMWKDVGIVLLRLSVPVAVLSAAWYYLLLR
jgi:hypothetical protein